MNNNEGANEDLFENNLLAVDKYLATINTADGKLGVGEHYLSQMWCTSRPCCARRALRGRAQRTNPCTFIYTNPCAILCTNPCCKINRTNPLYFFLRKCTCSTRMTCTRDTQMHAAANKVRSCRRSKSLRRGRKVVETLFLSG